MSEYHETGGGYTGDDDNTRTTNTAPATILPVTIKQLLTAELTAQNKFTIDGVQIQKIRVVAQIMSAKTGSQNNTVALELDDGTGRMDTRYWPTVDADEPDQFFQQEIAEWQEGVYVRVTGNLRQQKNSNPPQISLLAQNVVPISDYNEITCHYLEALYVHMYNLRGGAVGGGSAYGQAAYGAQTDSYANPYAQPAAMEDEDSGLTPLQRTVKDVVARVKAPQGASVTYIIQQLNGYNISEQEIRETIAYLCSEGQLYSTFDDDYYRC